MEQALSNPDGATAKHICPQQCFGGHLQHHRNQSELYINKNCMIRRKTLTREFSIKGMPHPFPRQSI